MRAFKSLFSNFTLFFRKPLKETLTNNQAILNRPQSYSFSISKVIIRDTRIGISFCIRNRQ